MFEKIMKKQIDEAKGRDAIFDRLHLVRIKAVREKNIRYEACDNYTSTDKVVKIMTSVFDDSDREMMVVVAVDTKMRPIQAEVASIGGLSECYVSIPNIFKGALLCNAAGIILAHNHVSSGLADPSEDDVEFTRRVCQAGQILGIRVHDHLILGCDGQYYSFAEDHKISKFENDFLYKEVV